MIARLQLQPVEIEVSGKPKKKRLTKAEKILKAALAANPGTKRIH